MVVEMYIAFYWGHFLCLDYVGMLVRVYHSKVHNFYDVFTVCPESLAVTEFWARLIPIQAWLLKRSFLLSVFTFLVLTLLILETKYFGLFGQYHSCWCPASLRSQGISRHGIDIIGYTAYRGFLLWIWSSSVEQKYDTKCEYIFSNV